MRAVSAVQASQPEFRFVAPRLRPAGPTSLGVRFWTFPIRPRRPERAYMDILKNAQRLSTSSLRRRLRLTLDDRVRPPHHPADNPVVSVYPDFRNSRPKRA